MAYMDARRSLFFNKSQMIQVGFEIHPFVDKLWLCIRHLLSMTTWQFTSSIHTGHSFLHLSTFTCLIRNGLGVLSRGFPITS